MLMWINPWGSRYRAAAGPPGPWTPASRLLVVLKFVDAHLVQLVEEGLEDGRVRVGALLDVERPRAAAGHVRDFDPSDWPRLRRLLLQESDFDQPAHVVQHRRRWSAERVYGFLADQNLVAGPGRALWVRAGLI